MTHPHEMLAAEIKRLEARQDKAEARIDNMGKDTSDLDHRQRTADQVIAGFRTMLERMDGNIEWIKAQLTGGAAGPGLFDVQRWKEEHKTEHETARKADRDAEQQARSHYLTWRQYWTAVGFGIVGSGVIGAVYKLITYLLGLGQ